MKYPKVLIPAALDLEHMEMKPLRKDQIAVFLHLIASRSTEAFEGKDRWAYLGFDYLKKFLPPNNISGLAKELEDRGIIKRIQSYEVGKRPKAYRIVAPYCHSLTAWEVRSTRARKKLMEHMLSDEAKQESRKKILARLPAEIHKQLFHDLTRLYIPPDREEAILKEIEPGDKLSCAQMVCKRLRDGDLFASVDEFGRRFHSNFTSLPKVLRAEVRVDGEKLIGVDISNSQPFLLSIQTGTATPDAKRFREVTEAGRLYETLAENRPGWTRQDAKEQIMPLFYGGRAQEDSELGRIFADIFPSAWKKLRELKKADLCIAKKLDWAIGPIVLGEEVPDSRWEDLKRPHRNSSRALQRLESEVMIETVAANLKAADPKRFIGTVHDSIFTPPQHTEEVKDAIISAFRDKFGATPAVSID